MTSMPPFAASPTAGGSLEVYDPMKRHQIVVLREAGLSIRQVAKQAQVDRNTVRKVLRESAKGKGPRTVGRPPIAHLFEASVRAILAERWDLPTVEILRRLREQGYAGGKDPVYRLVRHLRPMPVSPMVRFEGLAGEFCQNDFGSVRMRYDNGFEENLHFYASRLKWSRWVYVELVPNEQEEALSRALFNAFQYFGGVPLCCAFDNSKTVVVARQGDHIQWNATFGQVFLDYRLSPSCVHRDPAGRRERSRTSWVS